MTTAAKAVEVVNELIPLIQAFNLPTSMFYVVSFAFVLYACARMAAETYDKVARILPLLDAL